MISIFHRPSIISQKFSQYGSIRPLQSEPYRFDSTCSHKNFLLNNQTINLTINPQNEHLKTILLEHYLKTYNPLDVNLNDTNKQTITKENVKAVSYDDISSDTNDNCYPIYCTNKQKLHQNKRYIRLKEQDNCSATISIIDDRPSLASIKLPIVMITDCSDTQRLHTNIIEMNENE